MAMMVAMKVAVVLVGAGVVMRRRSVGPRLEG